LITRRCTQRQYLLRPDRRTNRIFLYCLAAAARRCGIRLLAWTAMSNHYHAIVQDPDARLPAFLEHFHKLLARVLNVRWGRWENFWSTEQTCAVYLVDAEDVFDKVVYVLANPVVDHLVDRVTDWPGASSFIYTGGTGTASIERPREFFRANGPMPERVTLTTVAPEGVDAQEWTDRVREAVAARELAAREERQHRGIRVVGRKAVLAMSPFDKPTTKAPRRNLRPSIACRNRQRRIRELQALKEFRQRYHRARTLLAAGRRDVLLPLGTYRWRLLGWSCEPPSPLPSTPVLSAA
jgi:REP element-mobilizing transposase RayT